MVSQSVSLGVEPQITIWQLRSCFCGAPSLTRERVCLCICCWPLPAQSFSGPSPLGLTTLFYCLRFETSLFVASYDLQGHGGAEQSRAAEQSSSLLPATSQHGHSWHRAPLESMSIYLFSVKTFVFFFFRCSSFDKKSRVGFFYNWCSFTTPYFTRGHIKVGDIYILYIFTTHKLTTTCRYICQCRIVQQLMPQLI
jgi:hypothetical protein